VAKLPFNDLILEIYMEFFSAPGMKEYKRIAGMNIGRVAIILVTRNGKKSPESRFALIVESARQYTIKMNELKFFYRSFRAKFPVEDDCTFCRFFPYEGVFELNPDSIRLRSTGESIIIKKVPYYEGLLDR